MNKGAGRMGIGNVVRRAVWVLALAGVMSACSSEPAQETRSKAELVSAETGKTSPGGTTFTVPA